MHKSQSSIQQSFSTILSDVHSLHTRADGGIQLIIEVDANNRKLALDAFSNPGAAIAIVRLPVEFDRVNYPAHLLNEAVSVH